MKTLIATASIALIFSGCTLTPIEAPKLLDSNTRAFTQPMSAGVACLDAQFNQREAKPASMEAFMLQLTDASSQCGSSRGDLADFGAIASKHMGQQP